MRKPKDASSGNLRFLQIMGRALRNKNAPREQTDKTRVAPVGLGKTGFCLKAFPVGSGFQGVFYVEPKYLN